MKKISLFLILLLPLSFLSAQEHDSARQVVIGGTSSFIIQNNTYPISILPIGGSIGGIFSNNTEDSRNVIFSLSPYFGKTINKQLLVGFNLDYRLQRYQDNILVFGQPGNVDYERNSDQFGLGIFTRFLVNPDNALNVYLQPALAFHLLTQELIQDGSSVQKEKASYLNVNVALGLLYNINEHWRILLRMGGISYISGRWKIEDSNTEKNFNSFGTNLNISSLVFGVELNL